MELNDNVNTNELFQLIGKLNAEKFVLEREFNKLMMAYQELQKELFIQNESNKGETRFGIGEENK